MDLPLSILLVVLTAVVKVDHAQVQGSSTFSEKTKRQTLSGMNTFIRDYIKFYDYQKIVILANPTFKGFVHQWFSSSPTEFTSVTYLTEGTSLANFTESKQNRLEQKDCLVIIFTEESRYLLQFQNLSREAISGLSFLVAVIPLAFEISTLRLPLDNKVTFVFKGKKPTDNSTFELWETYSVPGSNGVAQMKVSRWRIHEYSDFPRKETTHRRLNLLGAKLRCLSEGTVEYSEMKLMPSGEWMALGQHADAVAVLEEELNFTCIWKPAPDRQFGSLNEEGTWTGIVGELEKGHGDIAATFIDNTLSRSKAVDFLFTDEICGYVLVMKIIDQPLTIKQAFIKELTPLAWLCTITLLSFMVFFNCFINYFSLSEEIRMNFSESAILVWGSFTGQGYHQSVTSVSGRLVFTSIFIFTVLITAHYNSFLYSTLTIKKATYPFDGIRAILDDGTYNFGTFEGLASTLAIKDSDRPEMKEVWKNIEKNGGTVSTLEEAFGRLENEKFVLFMPQLGLQAYQKSIRLDITVLPGVYFSNPCGFAVSKNSELKKVFNEVLSKMRTTGITKKIIQDWRNKRTHKEEDHHRKLPLETFLSIFFLLGASGIIAVLVLVAEILFKKLYG